jgi:hypothetical protein
MFGGFCTVLIPSIIGSGGIGDQIIHVFIKKGIDGFWQFINGELMDGPVNKESPA